MTGINKNYKCRRIRGWLSEAISRHFGPPTAGFNRNKALLGDANRLQKHIANCPRCQRRVLSYGKVNLAISAIKSQPHKLDLLMCANAQAIGVLKHSLRQAQKAKELRTIRPEPKLRERFGKYTSSAVNVAACIAITLLMKFGVFSSVDTFQTQGQKVIKQYYASRAGDDLADEIFPTDNKSSVHPKSSVSLQ